MHALVIEMVNLIGMAMSPALKPKDVVLTMFWLGVAKYFTPLGLRYRNALTLEDRSIL